MKEIISRKIKEKKGQKMCQNDSIVNKKEKIIIYIGKDGKEFNEENNLVRKRKKKAYIEEEGEG